MRYVACMSLLVFGIASVAHATGESTMKLSSDAFSANGEIPVQFTCKGADKSPPLAWSDVPQGTKSLALIVDDPDAPDPAAPKRTWVHWVLFDIAPSTTTLAEGAGNAPPAAPARAGVNDWKKEGYGGPCPPIGRHRYFFKLYALDATLDSLASPDKAALEKAMSGHILGKAELVGTFQK
jgi:Raf kinase inhibitor-like YbhB/YbcL family protein